MKPGDIILFKGEKGLSRLIQWGTDSKYSHVAVCVSPAMHLAIEAMAGGGVRAIDIRRIGENYDVFRIKEAYSYDMAKTISFLVSKLNSGYDYTGVLFLGLIKLLAKLKLPLKNMANTFQKDRDYFCSELCSESFHRGGGLNITPNAPKADVTSPADIAKSPVVEQVK